MDGQILAGITSAAILATGLYKGYRRLKLSRAKYPSLTGHSRMAKLFTGLIPNYVYPESSWLNRDGVHEVVAIRRSGAFNQLVSDLEQKCPRTLAATDAIAPRISDIQFTRRYRIPFQFRNASVKKLQIGNVWESSHGSWLVDLDGNRYLDVSGSYGVNLFGLDFYKSTINEAVDNAKDLGPFLGGYHPSIVRVTEDLLAISGMDEISFHMSGTEAVMQAVRLARYHTGKRRLVRFCGAYHGWWDDVQPGPGNPMPPSRQTLTLREMHQRTLDYLATSKDIACVLINPIQAMHPNKAAPTDSMLIDGQRHVEFNREAYSAWLSALRSVCDARGIVMILDEVFLGFRLAKGGAQEYFGVRADLVTYGKTLGGGFPVGVLCGKSSLMRRFKEGRPADICFARGTFNAHPYVLTAMQAFLDKIKSPEIVTLYAEMEVLWTARRERLNRQLADRQLPLRFEGMPTVWSLIFTRPGRYHWLLQFYLRREGIVMSWVGTGRLIFNLQFSEQEFEEFSHKLFAAALQFQQHGWWAGSPHRGEAGRIRRQILKELLINRFKSASHGSWDRCIHPLTGKSVSGDRA